MPDVDPRPERIPPLPNPFSPLLEPGVLVSIGILGAFFLAFALLTAGYRAALIDSDLPTVSRK
jgi:hypothetical protein